MAVLFSYSCEHTANIYTLKGFLATIEETETCKKLYIEHKSCTSGLLYKVKLTAYKN